MTRFNQTGGDSRLPLRLVGAVVSAGLTVLAFPKFGLAPLGLIALVPLRLALAGLSPREAAGVGFTYGFISGWGLVYWVTNVITYYGKLPVWGSGLVVAGLVGFLSLFPTAWAYLSNRARLTGWSDILAAVCLWVGLEWVRRWLFTGFPWEDLGYVIGPWDVPRQIAELGGVGLASGLVVLTNLVVAKLINDVRAGLIKAPPLIAAAVVIVAWAATWGYGLVALGRIDYIANTAGRMTVRVVQGNVNQDVKWDPQFQRMSLEKYKELSLAPAAKDESPELIVWPETAAPFFFEDQSPERRTVLTMAAQAKAWLLFGAPAYRRAKEIEYYNRAWLVSPQGTVAGRTDKHHLVPFGEYAPLVEYLPFLGTVIPQAVGTYSAGPIEGILRAGRAVVGVVICYETIFPEVARAKAEAGANLLVNITNDSWFGDSSAPYQHLSMLRWRAMEQRRAIARRPRPAYPASSTRPAGYTTPSAWPKPDSGTGACHC